MLSLMHVGVFQMLLLDLKETLNLNISSVNLIKIILDDHQQIPYITKNKPLTIGISYPPGVAAWNDTAVSCPQVSMLPEDKLPVSCMAIATVKITCISVIRQS